MKTFLIGLALLLAAGKLFLGLNVSWFVVILPILIVPILFFVAVAGLAIADFMLFVRKK